MTNDVTFYAIELRRIMQINSGAGPRTQSSSSRLGTVQVSEPELWRQHQSLFQRRQRPCLSPLAPFSLLGGWHDDSEAVKCPIVTYFRCTDDWWI